MDRRRLLALAGLAATALPTAVEAGGPAADETGAVMNLPALGLPVIADGRLRNYVFVTLRLILFPGQNPQTVRPREPYLRDALVKAAHRTPFTVADDWTRLNARAVAVSVINSCPEMVGRGVVRRVEVVRQTPQRRTGIRGTR